MTELLRISREVIARYTGAGRTLGTAESLTGGMIAASLAGVSGASAVLMGGIVSYDPRVKHALLNVPQEVIDGVGVVSEQCARAMAEGARRALGVDVAISATGVAGPTGGTDTCPVGTVYIGVCDGNRTYAQRHNFEGGRQAVREQSAIQALMLALEALD